jgi:hypothetical protein
MTTDNFCFYLQNRLIQTSQTGGQWYSDTSPFSIPYLVYDLGYKNWTKKNLKSSGQGFFFLFQGVEFSTGVDQISSFNPENIEIRELNRDRLRHTSRVP